VDCISAEQFLFSYTCANVTDAGGESEEEQKLKAKIL